LNANTSDLLQTTALGAQMTKPHRLLIIEDNDELRTIFGRFFKKKQYDAVITSDGMDGLKLLEKNNQEFDLVITDIVIPHISGLGIISVLKDKYPEIPVIAITGWGEQPIALASEAKADQVMAKPFKLEELERLIMDLVLKKRAAPVAQTP
jgi:DNA-binding response OmpR family regulator